MRLPLTVLLLAATLACAQVPEHGIPPELGTSGPAYLQAWLVYGQGDYARAQKLAEDQLVVDRAGGNLAGQAEAENLLGTLLYKRGAYDRALPVYLEAEKLAEQAHYTFGVARDASSVGSTYFRLGKLQLAKQHYEQSLALRRAAGDRVEIARALNDLANVYQRLNDLPGAMSRRQEALALFQAAGSELGVADVLNDIGWTYDDMGDYPQALAYMQRSVALSTKIRYPWGVNDGTESAGLIYQHMGRYPEALAAMQSALAGFRSGDERDEIARTLTHLGDVSLAAGAPAKAIDYYQQALGLELEIGNRPIEGATLPGLMRAWQAAGKPALAVFYGKQAVNLFQEMRTDLRALDPQLQKSFLRDKEEVYRRLADLLLAEGRVAEAQHVLDMLKEEEYFDFVDRDPAESGLTLHAPASGKEAGLEEQMAALSARLASIGSERAALLERKQLTGAEQQRLRALDEQLRVTAAEFQQWLARVPQALGSEQAATGVEEMKQRVRAYGPGVAMIYTLVGADRYRALLVTAGDVASVERPATRADVARMVRDFRAALAPSADARDAGKQLYDMVLAPFAPKLAGVHTILFSLDGALRLAPMAALYDGRHFVVERFQTVVVTPASEHSLIAPTDPTWRPLAVGVSRAHDPFPALPSVRAETSEVVAACGRGQARLDSAFTEPELASDMQRHFDVVHIASHFVFHPGHVEDSFLLLGDGTPLTLAAMEKMPWLFSGVDLLTLSACNTAASESNGKELDGFSMLAQRRGAKAVLATLWPVADRSTALLMQRFYRARHTNRAAGKAAALRSAQLSLLHSRTFAQPFFWAPFVLSGNWK